ncbi:Cof-type HAD-IIB family hydrolase [Pallidibacillus thermolactis]|jgi:Cof subfamily protein (haloacid dehalogenase superfamily)|uniref:Cof-type HAD-IIB family hydrolase n=1 Tax=Pallidibacillus thermolactis TaxID=251051 RepID=UPI002E1BE5F9|nr:Cof-type HAD-IIB family hydrolase [Pallidibacillus thermolactis subsp. kokeshiiformis]
MSERFLIALDLDGTLLKDDKTISERTKKVLDQVQKEGHIVMISTGRPYRASELYYKQLNLTTPIVNFNGAFVHHPLDADWGVYHEALPLTVVKDIVDASIEYNIKNIVAEVMDNIFLHYHDEKLIDIFTMGQPKITTGDLRQYLKYDPTSLLIAADENNLKRVNDYLAETKAELVEHRSWASPFHVIEIVKAGINKAVGVKKVAEYYNIPQERVIAFGDEDNDLEMIEYAHYGVAMGNAIEPLKEVAKDITKTNEEDGIAEYLEKMLLA